MSNFELKRLYDKVTFFKSSRKIYHLFMTLEVINIILVKFELKRLYGKVTFFKSSHKIYHLFMTFEVINIIITSFKFYD